MNNYEERMKLFHLNKVVMQFYKKYVKELDTVNVSYEEIGESYKKLWGVLYKEGHYGNIKKGFIITDRNTDKKELEHQWIEIKAYNERIIIDLFAQKHQLYITDEIPPVLIGKKLNFYK